MCCIAWEGEGADGADEKDTDKADDQLAGSCLQSAKLGVGHFGSETSDAVGITLRAWNEEGESVGQLPRTTKYDPRPPVFPIDSDLGRRAARNLECDQVLLLDPTVGTAQYCVVSLLGRRHPNTTTENE